jgi:hypothetical protein
VLIGQLARRAITDRGRSDACFGIGSELFECAPPRWARIAAPA